MIGRRFRYTYFQGLKLQSIPAKTVSLEGEYSVDYFKGVIGRLSQELRGRWVGVKQKNIPKLKLLLTKLKELGISPYSYAKFVISQTPSNRRVLDNLLSPTMLKLYADTRGYPNGARVGKALVSSEVYLQTWKNYLSQKLTPSAVKEILGWMQGKNQVKEE